MLRAYDLKSMAVPSARGRNISHGATKKVSAKKKTERSFTWINRVLILIGVGVVLAAGVKAAVVLHAIPVERIVVTGKLEHTREVALQDMVQPALIGGFLSADLLQIREQLESLPWVYEVTVKRRWPNTLEIQVIEQLPIARWGEKGFLNHEGEVFNPSSIGSWGSLPLLSGPPGSERQLIDHYQLISRLLQAVELTVATLSVDARGQLRTTLDGGTEVLLGGEELRERLDRLVSLYDAGLRERKADVQRVDMRYQSGVAVAFFESPEVAGL